MVKGGGRRKKKNSTPKLKADGEKIHFSVAAGSNNCALLMF